MPRTARGPVGRGRASRPGPAAPARPDGALSAPREWRGGSSSSLRRCSPRDWIACSRARFLSVSSTCCLDCSTAFWIAASSSSDADMPPLARARARARDGAGSPFVLLGQRPAATALARASRGIHGSSTEIRVTQNALSMRLSAGGLRKNVRGAHPAGSPVRENAHRSAAVASGVAPRAGSCDHTACRARHRHRHAMPASVSDTYNAALPEGARQHAVLSRGGHGARRSPAARDT